MSLIPRVFRLIAASALIVLMGMGCQRKPAVLVNGADGSKTRVTVELATTPTARTQGLMYRRELAADAGMLFIFPADGVLHFWMRNTVIPLDMLFLDRDRRVVGIVENARPMSTEPVGPDQPARYVLEVNGGFAAQHHVAVGATVEFVGVPEGAS